MWLLGYARLCAFEHVYTKLIRVSHSLCVTFVRGVVYIIFRVLKSLLQLEASSLKFNWNCKLSTQMCIPAHLVTSDILLQGVVYQLRVISEMVRFDPRLLNIFNHRVGGTINYWHELSVIQSGHNGLYCIAEDSPCSRINNMMVWSKFYTLLFITASIDDYIFPFNFMM